MKKDKGETLTTDELLNSAFELSSIIIVLHRGLKGLYEEIDARLDITEYMSLSGKAAQVGKLITDDWLWNDLEEEETDDA